MRKLIIPLLGTALWVLACSQVHSANRTHPVVDTGQDRCYDAYGRAIAPPKPGQPFYGQDAQTETVPMRYRDNRDGTVSDLNTGLMWQQTPIYDITYDEAVNKAKTLDLGGYKDWRLPTIKELYSLIDFRGCMGRNIRECRPFINTRYFDFQYGDESRGQRFIDVQCWSSNRYVSTTMNGIATVFGVNFADGRIKGYGLYLPFGQRAQIPKVVRYVRGDAGYGVNDFVDNGNGTVTDRTTGLMWMKVDSGSLKAGLGQDGRLNWQQALAWADGLKYAGYKDWRLPDAKELESIVDYTRSPDTTDSPAIDPVFETTPIKNAAGQRDFPYFWTSTTHLDGMPRGSQAVYVAFGRATGFMAMPPHSRNLRLLDVHGAGAQRSDPKAGNPADFPHGRGPQGDVIRIYNFARCVRFAKTAGKQ